MHLHDKFHIADTTRTQLDIVFQPLAPDLGHNHAFQFPQCIDCPEIHIAPVNEWPQHLHQITALFRLGPHDTGLDHGITLPGPAMLLVIIFQRGKACHQRTGITERPQPHIDPVDLAIGCLLMQGIDQLLPETGKERLIIQFTAPALGITTFRVGKNQVNIGRKVKLAAPQLTHTENQHLLWLTAFPADWGSYFTAHVGIQPVIGCHDQTFRQHREMPEALLHR